LDWSSLEEVFATAPTTEHALGDLVAGVSLVELLPQTTLAKSKREAREFLANGAVSLNGEKVGEEATLTTGQLLHGKVALLRRGKKLWHVTRWL
jgi:tyrosyl-tRNA synthetase